MRKEKAEVFSYDLCKEKFDPVLTVEELGKNLSKDVLVNQYKEELVQSDALIFVHSNWWGQPPAILKGYVDRVIRRPYAYDFPEGDSGGGGPIGELAGKTGIVFNASNTPAERENGYFQDLLNPIWIKRVFGFRGIEKTYRNMFRVIADSAEEDRI